MAPDEEVQYEDRMRRNSGTFTNTHPALTKPVSPLTELATAGNYYHTNYRCHIILCFAIGSYKSCNTLFKLYLKASFHLLGTRFSSPQILKCMLRTSSSIEYMYLQNNKYHGRETGSIGAVGSLLRGIPVSESLPSTFIVCFCSLLFRLIYVDYLRFSRILI